MTYEQHLSPAEILIYERKSEDAQNHVRMPWQHLPLIAIANNAGSLPLLICAILITLLAI